MDSPRSIAIEESDTFEQSRVPDDVGKPFSNVVHYEGCWKTADIQLLRALSLASVLWRGGKCFSSSGGSFDTYKMSRPVQQIDTFLSHNWSVPRFAKFFVLALHFNFRKAVASMYLSALAMLLLRVLVDVRSPDLPVGHQGVDYCMFVGLFAFFACMCFAHDICCGSSAKVFLDKSCIHQTNAELKAQGISALPSFVLSSSEMVIVLGEDYLRRLWTTYELASFLLLNPTARMTPLPLHLPRFVFGFMMWSIMFMYAHVEMVHLKDIAISKVIADGDSHTGHNHADESHRTAVFVVICAAVVPMTIALLVLAVEHYMRAQRHVYDTVQLFDIRKAACFYEPDRIVVEDSVVEFMKANLDVISYVAEADRIAQRTELLDEFNRIARAQIPESLTCKFGRVGLPYKYACLIFSAFVLRSFDTLAISMHVHVPAWQIGQSIVVTGFRAFALWPCWLGLICSICRASADCNSRRLTSSWTSLIRISAGLGLFAIFWAMDMFLFTSLVTLDDGSEVHDEHEGHDEQSHAGHDQGEHGKAKHEKDEDHDAHEEDEHRKNEGKEHAVDEEDEDHDAHEDNEHMGNEGDEHAGGEEYEGHDALEDDAHNENQGNVHAGDVYGKHNKTYSGHDHSEHDLGNNDHKIGSMLSYSSTHDNTEPEPAELVASFCAAVLVLCLLAWLWRPFRRCRGLPHTARMVSNPAPPDDGTKRQVEHASGCFVDMEGQQSMKRPKAIIWL